MSGTVLVTGATGFVGRHLVPELVARGFSVRVALRRPKDIAGLAIEVAPFIVGDLAKEIDWQPSLEGADAVVHLAGLAHTGGGIADTGYDRVNRMATVRLAGAAQDAGARLIFMSSVRAQSGPTAVDTLTEASPAIPTDAYGRSKLAAEREIAALGGRFIVLRPTLIYGKGVGGNMRALMRLAALPLPLPFGAIRNARSLLAIENLTSAILLALTSDAMVGGTFLVADAAPVSLAEIVAFLRKGGGRSPGLIPVPPALLGGALRLFGQGATRDRLAGSLVVSTDRLAAMGYTPTVTTEVALAALGASGAS